MSSFLNLEPRELDKPIYRFMSFPRLVDMIESKTLTLAHPTKWDDPFETHVIGATFAFGTATTHRAHRKVIHGQCWTTKSVSDALWRIYSPNKDAVRIASTPRLLSAAIGVAIAREIRSKAFVGRVTYLAQKSLVEQAETLAKRMLVDRTEEAAAQSLLFKRNSFSHEAEVRALVVDRHNRAKGGLLSLKIDPHSLIQGVLVDSRAPKSLVNVYAKYLREELAFTGRVRRSTLYDPPPKLMVQMK